MYFISSSSLLTIILYLIKGISSILWTMKFDEFVLICMGEAARDSSLRGYRFPENIKLEIFPGSNNFDIQ